MAKRRAKVRRRKYTPKRAKKGRASRKKTVSRNAKKIASNRRSITALQKETREHFTVQDERTLQLTDETRLPGQQNAICTIPIMPLFQIDPLPAGSTPPFGWGAWGVRDLGQMSSNAANGPIITNSLNFTRPVTRRGGGAASSLNPELMSRYSKLRHTGCTIDFELVLKQWDTMSTQQPPKRITKFWRPRRVNMHMFVISAKKKYADALLRDRDMYPQNFAPNLPAGTHGGLGFVNPALAWQLGINQVDGSAGYFGLRQNEDFTLQNNMRFEPKFNPTLWDVHYTKRMKFGYRGDQQTFTEVDDEIDVGGDGSVILRQPLPPLLSAGATDPPNWYQRGRIKFPAYGNMYDMRPDLVNAAADADVGGRQASKIEVPNKMDRNDLSNERQRFIVFIHDGNRPQNWIDPATNLPAYDPTAGYIQMRWSMRNSYTCSGGGMLD